MISFNNATQKIICNEKNFCLGHEKIYSIINDILSNTREYANLIVYDPDCTFMEKPPNMNWIIKTSGDLTGFEASCNELVFELKECSCIDAVRFTSILQEKLTEVFFGKKFCVITILCLGRDSKIEKINTRFHSIRKGEGMWCESNLDLYEEPVIVAF